MLTARRMREREAAAEADRLLAQAAATKAATLAPEPVAEPGAQPEPKGNKPKAR